MIESLNGRRISTPFKSPSCSTKRAGSRIEDPDTLGSLNVTTYTYDVMSRLLTERADATAFPSEVGNTFTYDAHARVETMVDASGTTTHVYVLISKLKRCISSDGGLPEMV